MGDQGRLANQKSRQPGLKLTKDWICPVCRASRQPKIPTTGTETVPYATSYTDTSTRQPKIPTTGTETAMSLCYWISVADSPTKNPDNRD